MNPLAKNSSPQVAAVTQTLAGERMTHTVSFPTTGDLDCDFIQGLLAVLKATEISTHNAVLVLRYMVDRMSAGLDRQKQLSEPDMDSLVRMHVQRYAQEQALRQAALSQPPPYYGQVTSAGSPVCPNPFTTSSAMQASDALAGLGSIMP